MVNEMNEQMNDFRRILLGKCLWIFLSFDEIWGVDLMASRIFLAFVRGPNLRSATNWRKESSTSESKRPLKLNFSFKIGYSIRGASVKTMTGGVRKNAKTVAKLLRPFWCIFASNCVSLWCSLWWFILVLISKWVFHFHFCWIFQWIFLTYHFRISLLSTLPWCYHY